MISDVRHLNFVPDENHLSVTFSAHARPAEFRLTDEQVVLLWEQLGVRMAKLARKSRRSEAMDALHKRLIAL